MTTPVYNTLLYVELRMVDGGELTNEPGKKIEESVAALIERACSDDQLSNLRELGILSCLNVEAVWKEMPDAGIGL